MCSQSTGVSAGNAMTSLLNKCKCKRTSCEQTWGVIQQTQHIFVLCDACPLIFKGMTRPPLQCCYY